MAENQANCTSVVDILQWICTFYLVSAQWIRVLSIDSIGKETARTPDPLQIHPLHCYNLPDFEAPQKSIFLRVMRHLTIQSNGIISTVHGHIGLITIRLEGFTPLTYLHCSTLRCGIIVKKVHRKSESLASAPVLSEFTMSS